MTRRTSTILRCRRTCSRGIRPRQRCSRNRRPPRASSSAKRAAPPPSNKQRRTRTRTGRHRGRLGATRACKALGAPTTCAAFRASGRKRSARRSRLSQEQFLERATTQQTGRTRAATTETFLRNEWGTRTFGFTSLVVDPPNGRTPPLNDAGRARQAGFGGSRHVQLDQVRLVRRLLVLRPLHRARHQPRHGRRDLRQRYPHLSEPRRGDDHLRDDSRDSRDQARPRSPVHRPAAVHRQRARLLRRRHARRRDSRLHRQIERRRRPEQRQHGHDGAHSPRRSRDDRVPHHDQRSGHVHGAVHGAHDVDHAAQLLRVRVLLPRRQLRGLGRIGRRTCVRAAGSRGDRRGHASRRSAPAANLRDPEEGAQVFDINAGE